MYRIGLSGKRVAAICGVKNSGKTTLIEKMLRELSKRGFRTAVIKHDDHDFVCDVAGTDSDRFGSAGAYGVAVYSDQRVFIHKTGSAGQERQLIPLFPEADLVLLEGLKDSAYPKIEVVRRQISDRSVSNPTGRFLIVTDWEPGHFREETAGLEEIGRIVDRMLLVTACARN